MQFTRLRLSGFKSFVDPTDFPIEPGLTGVVGPNGCGKSNLLEALRWVMGATSAKALRGEGMEDVIFAGAAGRAGRSHAEVVLRIEAAAGRAPARFAAEPVLEVSRRIDRGAGSTYRINGVEMRARDVQLLFADASTGANSPALVRQGQISELIAARPQNRRRILEEAAGVAGLHGRRHEALLRVRAAEANLERLDDVIKTLESGLGRLRREARAAGRYRRLSAQIRALQSAVLLARWTEAREMLIAARTEAEGSLRRAETATREAVAAQTAAMTALEALPALRDEDVTAAAVLQHATIEKDRADRAAESAQAEVDRLKAELARLTRDEAHEAQSRAEAEQTLQRVAGELAQVEREIAAAPERLPALRAALETAEADQTRLQAAVETEAARLAQAQAESRAAAVRLTEAEAQFRRVDVALNQARAERARLGPLQDPGLDAARADAAAAEADRDFAAVALERLEGERLEAARLEAQARTAARAAEDAAARIQTEVRGLERLLASEAGRSGFAAVLDAVSAPADLAAALAAALGEDLTASLDSAAPRLWSGRHAPPPPPWPPGVTALDGLILAPEALAARLSHIGLVEDVADGERLAKTLPPGARLVSRRGDLWRWDGFVERAGAARPAQVRLEQRARLDGLRADLTARAAAAEEGRHALDIAAARLATCDRALPEARNRPRQAERALQAARERLAGLERQEALRAARAQSLDETVTRLEQEADQAGRGLEAARSAVAAHPANGADPSGLDAARAAAAAARNAAFEARSALDREVGARNGRQRRLEGLKRDHGDWSRRWTAALNRVETLAKEMEATRLALDTARSSPDQMIQAAADRADALSAAQRRRERSAAALAEGEARREAADRAVRAAESEAADAREARASAQARLESAQTRLEEQLRNLKEATGLEPEALARSLETDAIALPADAGGAETQLASLERERDSLGAVNLLADEEAEDLSGRLRTMAEERSDLTLALDRLRQGIEALNAEGRERLAAAFDIIDGHFRDLFTTLFEGGSAELRLVESDDPLEAGLEIMACPPGKRLSAMSLMSGGEQALTAIALIFAVFLANPAPVCVLDEVDAPLDDANVERFCRLLDEMRRRSGTRFLTITHNPLTMSRMDRLFGVTMPDKGVSRLVSVDLRQAETLVAG